jgi:hypothetical protein
MIVTSPLEMPNSKVKTSGAVTVAPPASNARNDSGMMAMETRPTSIGCHLRATVRSQIRPATCATPLSEAIQTATTGVSPDASRTGTKCAAMAPKTTALAATITPNSSMARVRAAPCSAAAPAPGSVAAAVVG